MVLMSEKRAKLQRKDASDLVLTKRDVKRLERAQRAAAPRRAKKPGIMQRMRETGAQAGLAPSAQGWKRRGGGPVGHIEQPFEMQGTTVQVCGLYPFINGASSPMVGVPLGFHLQRNTLVCGDPVSWFLNGIVSNPSAFILGQPGLGKTTLIHRLIAVLRDWGIIPMILSDSRPDYVGHISRLDGQVITFAPGKGHLNPLDLGPLVAELNTIEDTAQRNEALEEMRNRRRSLMQGLVSMMLGRGLLPHESSVLAQVLLDLDRDMTNAPLLGDVISHIQSRPELLRNVLQAYEDDEEYDVRVRSLLDALITLGPTGAYGDMFARPSDTQIMPGVPVVFDISGIDENDGQLTAAVQSLCWNLGSATVSAEKYLAEAGKRRRRTYFLVMDELWRIVRASDEMVQFVDTITRLNRGRGLGQAMCTHTMNDLKLSKEHLTATAWGFVERSAMVYLGGLSPNEMGNLEEVFGLTAQEKSYMTDWTSEAPVDPKTGRAKARPGAGHFLLKVGKTPGIPFATSPTPLEFEVSDTNKAWEMKNRG